MSNYFSQFIPHLRNDKVKPNLYVTVDSKQSTPILKYICAFNPGLVNEKEDTTEEFLKQILCFSTGNETEELDESTRIEQLKLIGLIRGVDSFARNFTTSEGKTNIIKSSKSSIILHHIEKGYYLACSVTNSTGLINQQLIKLIETGYQYFVLFHLKYGSILKRYGLDILRDMLQEFWTGFLKNYNAQSYSVPSASSWPNMMNSKGFLGLIPFPSNESFKRIYKKSSISLNPTAKKDIDQILSGNSSDSTKKPRGLIISYFDKLSPKKYGMIYMNNFHDNSLNEEVIQKDSLVDIYNWLEHYDYHNKLDSPNITNINSSSIFSSNLPSQQSDLESTENGRDAQLSDDLDVMSLRTATVAAIEMLNPINLTNNLVVSPLNYTMNSMINIGGQVTDSITNAFPGSSEASEINGTEVAEERAGWLSLPPMLRNFRLGANEEPPLVEGANTSISDASDVEDDKDSGEYLAGIRLDPITNTLVIHRKLVYLPTKYEDEQGNIHEQEREYSLVIFTNFNIYITLVFDSSSPEMDKIEFYENLAKELLNPAIEEINNSILGGSLISNSLGSLKSLNGILNNSAGTDLDSDFFFVVFDGAEGWIKSSLPYLPNIGPIIPTSAPGSERSATDSTTSNSNLAIADRVIVKYRSAMFFLHEQLISVFLMQKNKDFFTDNQMNEYFHKFTSNKSNDWMFYYIKHKGKYIIIIKNHNRNSKNGKKTSVAAAVAANYRKANLAPDDEQTPTVFHKIADGAYDYAQLGFLDNLGVDVKYWLESFNHNGDT